MTILWYPKKLTELQIFIGLKSNRSRERETDIDGITIVDPTEYYGCIRLEADFTDSKWFIVLI